MLTGFIGALLARGLPPFEAAGVGGFVHGRIADDWIRDKKDADALTASDLKDLLPENSLQTAAETHGIRKRIVAPSLIPAR